ncbi:molybdenum cofactor synthesis domain-containing protein [Dendrosporobacter sp. 1207_IL3150]|uniref:molybdenum cofactor synthesis domain-containing protein n=1 Tax=Dendrosporobacter sp. 1207_IL3150 TaxID=3084054 RepID=UPI002FD9BD39
MSGTITAVCISKAKGVRKEPVPEAQLCANWGIEGDAHAGKWHRQISLLSITSVDKMREASLERGIDLAPGDFAENLTVAGMDVAALPIGTYLTVGDALLEVTQIGKKCHHNCEIFKQVGECVMPKEGIFARVLKGGKVSTGDKIEVWNGIPVAVITASDKGSKGEREDLSGQEIKQMISEINGEVIDYRILPDDIDILAGAMTELIDQTGAALVLTTGGTGFAQRDVTPEATLKVIERQVPGLPEAMRRESYSKTSRAMLSRATSGIRGKSLIVNLPGSPKGVRECLQVIMPVLPHAIEILRGTGGECGKQ